MTYKLKYPENLPTLCIHPESASLDDIAQMATDLLRYEEFLRKLHWELTDWMDKENIRY